MPQEQKRENMKEAYQNAVKNAIGGNKDHGWGKEDSMLVIQALYLKATGEEMTPEHKAMVASVVNPSAARQAFAKAGLLNEETKKQKIANTFMEF